MRSIGSAHIFVLAGFGLFVACRNCSLASSAVPESEKRGVIERLSSSWKTVDQLHIEYDVEPLGQQDGLFPVHSVMAVSAPGNLRHFSAHQTPLYPWQEDPYQQEFFVYKGNVCHQWPFRRTFSEGILTKGSLVPGSFSQDILLTILPRWPITDYKIPEGQSGLRIIPIEAARSSHYQLLNGSEEISGETCSIFDNNGIDRIWIAAHKGFCVMRRDLRSDGGKMLQQILTEKIEEIKPGLWMPTQFRKRLYDAETTSDIRVHIVRCLLNVHEASFEPQHRPGSLKYSGERPAVQVTKGGEDLLDQNVSFLVNYAKLPSKRISQNRSVVWFMGGLISGLGVAIMLFPKRKPVQT